MDDTLKRYKNEAPRPNTDLIVPFLEAQVDRIMDDLVSVLLKAATA